jgi:hypothetical protein
MFVITAFFIKASLISACGLWVREREQCRAEVSSEANIYSITKILNLSHWVMHPVARVSTNIVENSVRNKCRCSFYCALFTLHVSAPIGGHLQVVCKIKNSKSVAVYVNGSLRWPPIGAETCGVKSAQ